MNYKSNYRLFGRSKGRSKNNIINEEALQMKVKKIDPLKYNVIDIGSGFGESTLEFAKSDNKKNIIACEKYLDGINKLANLCKTEFLKNVFIYHGNFHQLLDEHCPIKSISEIWILFPDPWPKKRHNKRRLIDNNFFIKLKKYLKKNGTINIATDSKQYVSEILNLIYIVKNDFLWENQSKEEWDYKNLSLPKTKYCKKALENGLNPIYLKMVKL